MLNSKSFAALVLSMYLRFCLLIGCHRYVYRLTAKWGKSYSKMPLRWLAAEDVQQRLVKKGYCLCPVCCFVTEYPNQHLEDLDSSCYWLHVASLPQCPKCYAPVEEGTECANCKINLLIDEQQREMLKQEHEREKEWEREILAVEQDLADERQEALNDEYRGVRRFYEEANCPDKPGES